MTATRTGPLIFLILYLFTLGCDSPPWSRFVVANTTAGDITARFYTPYPSMASPYLYSAEEWNSRKHFSAGTPPERFNRNEEEGWIEVVLSPGSAVEIDRARYPDVENDPERTFLIDRLETHGGENDISWNGRKTIFNRFTKEDDWIWSRGYGMSPIFVIYIK